MNTSPTSALRISIALIFGLWLTLLNCGAYSPALAEDLVKNAGEFKPDAIYRKSCSVCHGDRGNGLGRASVNLNPKPRDFTQASNLTREAMINAVTHGRPGTAMMAWTTRYNEQQIAAIVDYIRGRFMLAALDPHMDLGRGVYGHFCQTCHGDRGQGIISADLGGTAPHDLTAPQVQARLTRERILATVMQGQHGSTIPAGFAAKLSQENIGAVVDYMHKVLLPDLAESGKGKPSALPQTNAASPAATTQADMSQPMPKGLVGDINRGGKFFMANCATCHGKLGNGEGPRAYFLTPKPRNFHDDYSHTSLNRPALFTIITNGKIGTVMPAWGKVLNDQEIANVGEFVFRTFIQPKTGTKAATK